MLPSAGLRSANAAPFACSATSCATARTGSTSAMGTTYSRPNTSSKKRYDWTGVLRQGGTHLLRRKPNSAGGRRHRAREQRRRTDSGSRGGDADGAPWASPAVKRGNREKIGR